MRAYSNNTQRNNDIPAVKNWSEQLEAIKVRVIIIKREINQLVPKGIEYSSSQSNASHWLVAFTLDRIGILINQELDCLARLGATRPLQRAGKAAKEQPLWGDAPGQSSTECQ